MQLIHYTKSHFQQGYDLSQTVTPHHQSNFANKHSLTFLVTNWQFPLTHQVQTKPLAQTPGTLLCYPNWAPPHLSIIGQQPPSARFPSRQIGRKSLFFSQKGGRASGSARADLRLPFQPLSAQPSQVEHNRNYRRHPPSARALHLAGLPTFLQWRPGLRLHLAASSPRCCCCFCCHVETVSRRDADSSWCARRVSRA